MPDAPEAREAPRLFVPRPCGRNTTVPCRTWKASTADVAKEPRDYLRWDLLDRSEDPVPWDTDDVIGLSRFYEKLSDAAKDAAADMRRLDGDELGEGDTVAALKELVKELPKHLDKAQDAYEKGYKALDRWQTSLGTARLDSASIARQAATAHAALEDPEAWKEKVDGDDPARDAFITRLTYWTVIISTRVQIMRKNFANEDHPPESVLAIMISNHMTL